MARWLHMASAPYPLQGIGRRAVEVLVQRIEALRREELYTGPSRIVMPTETGPARRWRDHSASG